jgi:hypothetical protein
MVGAWEKVPSPFPRRMVMVPGGSTVAKELPLVAMSGMPSPLKSAVTIPKGPVFAVLVEELKSVRPPAFGVRDAVPRR